MEADRGFVEDVQRSDECRSERRGQVYALAFTAREGGGKTVECEIFQSDINKETKTATNFGQKPPGYAGVGVVEFQRVEPFEQFTYRHHSQLREGTAADLDIHRLGPQACAVTRRAECLAAVAGFHHAELYLVLVLVEHFEETVYARESGRAVPQLVFLLLRELAVGTVHGESGLSGYADERPFVLAHLLSAPGSHGVVEYRQCRVGDHQALVDPQAAAEPLAHRAGAERIVEIEK